jgi:hypothetical protein
MMDLAQLKARVARLEELVNGLTAELAAWELDNAPLKQGERIWYLGQIEWARDTLDKARQALQAAVKRVEDDRRWGR